MAKVKKAKKIREEPEHSKFIEDIVKQGKSRPPEWEHIESPLPNANRPVVEYSPQKKGGILNGEGQGQS